MLGWRLAMIRARNSDLDILARRQLADPGRRLDRGDGPRRGSGLSSTLKPPSSLREAVLTPAEA
jgi:hypothetical protein